MREASILLLLTFISLLLQATQTRRQVGLQNVILESEETFLDSLIGNGNDLASTFGLEVLQGLHTRTLECGSNFSSVEMKYNKRIDKLLKYHHDMENLISLPEFEDFTNEDRPSIESNFHRTLKHTERIRDRELLKIKAHCDAEQRDWLGSKFLSAVVYAKDLISSDRDQYRVFAAQVNSYKVKMQNHLDTCRNGHSFGQLYCYVDELETLVDMMGEFLIALEHLTVMYYGDDEDLASGNEGSGSEEPESEIEFRTSSSHVPVPITTPTTPPTTTPTTPIHTLIHTLKLPQGFFGVGPVIITPHKEATPKTTPTSEWESSSFTSSKQTLPISPADAYTPTSTDTPTKQTPTISPADTPASVEDELTQNGSQESPTDQPEISVSRSQAETHSGSDSTEIPPSTPPSPTQALPWLERAFDEVKERRMHVSSNKKKTKAHASDASGSVEVQASYGRQELNIGASSARPVIQSLVLDPEPTVPQKDASSWNYTYYIFGFFLLTFAAVLAIVIVVIVSVRRVRRRGRRGQGGKEPPIISENEMLDVMKKTGYVNPTYKFYTEN